MSILEIMGVFVVAVLIIIISISLPLLIKKIIKLNDEVLYLERDLKRNFEYYSNAVKSIRNMIDEMDTAYYDGCDFDTAIEMAKETGRKALVHYDWY